MKNFYSISKAQLITVWLFVIFFCAYVSNSYDHALGAIGITLFFGAVFYTLGWRSHNRS